MIKNLHLGVSAFIIIVVGLTYGFYHNEIFPSHFIFEEGTTDLKNVFRGLMGLYLAMAIYWIIGTLKSNHWRSATISCTIFMGGLAFGRIINLIAEGIPSSPFIIGLILELLLAFWGVFNIKKFETTISDH